MHLSLHQYLTTGNLDLIRRGTTKNQIIAALGEPSMVGGTSRKYKKPSILKYGNLEITLAQPERDIASSIALSFDPNMEDKFPDGWSLDLLGFNSSMTLKDVMLALDTDGIKYRLKPSAFNGLEVLEIIQSGVEVFFDEDGCLYGVGSSLT